MVVVCCGTLNWERNQVGIQFFPPPSTSLVEKQQTKRKLRVQSAIHPVSHSDSLRSVYFKNVGLETVRWRPDRTQVDRGLVCLLSIDKTIPFPFVLEVLNE